MTLHRSGLLSLTLLRRLLVEFTPTKLGEDTGLFAGALEATQGGVEILVLANTNAGHSNLNDSRQTAPPSFGDRGAHSKVRPHKRQRQASADEIPQFGLQAVFMRVIGIESSCDETAVAVYDDTLGLLSHRLYSQIAMHQAYGGVVPELASRDHVRAAAAAGARGAGRRGLGTRLDRRGGLYRRPRADRRLLVGAGFARSLAYAWGIPAVGIHHLEGHLLAPLLEPEPPAFPVSRPAGLGRPHAARRCARPRAVPHLRARPWTMRRARHSTRRQRCWGCLIRAVRRSRDLAETGRSGRFSFPRPMLDRPGLDFSFSGLKTAALVALRGRDLDDEIRADVARGFQEAVVDTLAEKCAPRARGHGPSALGGRRRGRRQSAPARAAAGRSRASAGAELYFPRAEFCTDNGAMIALAGCLRLAAGERGKGWRSVLGRIGNSGMWPHQGT